MRADPSVTASADFRRVAALPRRRVSAADAEALVEPWTRRLALRPDAKLRRWQAYSLQMLREHRDRGVFLGLPVGQGKRLISWLAPTVVGAQRPLLLLPGGHKGQCQGDFAKFVGVWRAPRPPIKLLGFEDLRAAKSADFLERFAPDLIMIDEADLLRNWDDTAVIRLDIFVRAESPVVLSEAGSLGRIPLDMMHHLAWCLGDQAPVPLDHDEAELWSAALVGEATQCGAPPGVGALTGLAGPGTWAPTRLEQARAAYRIRLNETPGVLIVDEDSCTQPLNVSFPRAPEDATIEAAFQLFRETDVLPGGEEATDALSRYRLSGELGTGQYPVWDPPAPEDWIAAYKAKNAFVRDRLASYRRSVRAPLHTEAQVLARYRTEAVVREWQEIRGTFRPRSVPQWISSSVVEWAVELSASSPMLVWCWNRAVAEAIAALGQLPHYGAKGLDTKTRRYIEQGDASRSAVLSIKANLRGRNLQAWSDNLILNPPQSGFDLEQVIGRTARANQAKPVHVRIALTSGDIEARFSIARLEAALTQSTSGLTQKILAAKITPPEPADRSSPFRWAIGDKS